MGSSASTRKRRRECAAWSARATAVGRVAAGENETEVTGAFRKRNEPLIRLGGDANVVHASHRARLLESGDAAKDAALRNRDHHHAGCVGFALPVRRRFAERVAEQQLLE